MFVRTKEKITWNTAVKTNVVRAKGTLPLGAKAYQKITQSSLISFS
jgi:hypothetical protein